MLYLSASSISDFYRCPMSYHYRVNNKESAILSDDLILGQVIHTAVEKYDDFYSAFEFADAEWKNKTGARYSVPRKPPKSIKKLIKGYFDIMDEVKGTADYVQMEKEHFFRFKYRSDIMLVGKIDLMANGCIFDWKTSPAPPSNYVLYDPQFTIYWLAYRQLFKRDPEKIYYGWLYGGRLYEVPMDEALLKNLDLILDRMAEICYNMENTVRLMGYQCSRCMYRGICYSELEGKNESVGS
jgi:CRISPR/Cas system-associated exonuclease Cas4 (RecB family)